MYTEASNRVPQYQLYKLAVVAGYTSVTNECSFSALQAIDAPRRRSIAFLYFEKEVLSSITFDDFVKEWFKKPRKLDI